MYKENGRFEENERIQDNANTDSFENVIKKKASKKEKGKR